MLRHGGRLALYNLSPHDMPDFIDYPYFSESQDRDLADFWPPRRIAAEMRAGGFVAVTTKRRHLRFDHELADFLATVRRRESNSQLMTLSDAAYAAGVSRLERELTGANPPPPYPDHLCFVTIRGDKPANIG